MNATVEAVVGTLRGSRIKQFLKAVGDKTYRAQKIVHRHRKMIEERQEHLFYQSIMLLVVLGLSALVALEGSFQYPYLVWSVRLEDVLAFWPLFLWGIVLTVFLGEEVYSSHLDGQLWLWGMITGNMAALWEEIGYRGVYIAFAMVFVFGVNWALGTALGWVLVAAFVVLAVGIFLSDEAPSALATIPVILAGVSAVFLTQNDPLYWFYEELVIPLIGFLSFGSFTELVAESSGHEPLFIMGAIVANGWFRDGHKYQGWFGFLDSWMYGFVAIYATMTYGLLTTIVIHGIWNSNIYTIRYIKRKLNG